MGKTLTDALRRAKREPYTERDLADFERKYNEAISEVRKVERKHNDLYGVEKNASDAINSVLEKHREEAEDWRYSMEVAEFSLRTNYRRLSLEPLKWRKRGKPTFALYELENPRMEFYSNHTHHGIRTATYGAINECYQDIIKDLDSLYEKHNAEEVTMTAEFNGVIPSSVRANIENARTDFDDIYFLAEVKKWDVAIKRPPAPPRDTLDPLVVGYKYRSLWVIDHFDPTPIEEYLLREFAVKSK